MPECFLGKCKKIENGSSKSSDVDMISSAETNLKEVENGNPDTGDRDPDFPGSRTAEQLIRHGYSRRIIMKKTLYAGLFVSSMIAVCFSVAANENDFQRLKEFARQIPMECDYNTFFDKLSNKYRENCQYFESYSDRLSDYNTRKDQCLQEIDRINSRIQSLQSEITNLQNIQRGEFEERNAFSQRQDNANRRIIEIRNEIQSLESKKYTINNKIDSEPARIDDPSKQFKFRIEEHPVKIVLNNTNYSISRFDIDNKCFTCEINKIQLYDNDSREGEKNFIVSASIPSQKIKLYFDDAMTAKNFKEKYLAGENIVLPSAARIEIDYYLGKREVKAAEKRLIRPAVTRKKTITIERNNIGKKAMSVARTTLILVSAILARRYDEDYSNDLISRGKSDVDRDMDELLHTEWRMRDQTREVDEVVIPAEYEETPAQYQDNYRYQLNFTVTLESQYNWNQIKDIPVPPMHIDSNSSGINKIIVAAERGDINAQLHLGDCYYFGGSHDGETVNKNYNKAIFWYRKAAEQGNAEAQFNLAYMYEQGLATDSPDYSQAFYWYKRAAEQGKASAQYNVGYYYKKGRGISQNLSEAYKWYKRAADQGHQNAIDELKKNLKSNENQINKNKSDSSNISSLNDLITAAQNGDIRAQVQLGDCYYSGIGFYKGEIVEKNYEKAVFWFLKAARQGDARAQFNLAFMYEQGLGVDSQNYDQAFYWYKKAAEQGDERAQYNVGYYYENGRGTSQNLSEAYNWYKRAADQGHQNAIDELKRFQ